MKYLLAFEFLLTVQQNNVIIYIEESELTAKVSSVSIRVSENLQRVTIVQVSNRKKLYIHSHSLNPFKEHITQNQFFDSQKDCTGMC